MQLGPAECTELHIAFTLSWCYATCDSSVLIAPKSAPLHENSCAHELAGVLHRTGKLAEIALQLPEDPPLTFAETFYVLAMSPGCPKPSHTRDSTRPLAPRLAPSRVVAAQGPCFSPAGSYEGIVSVVGCRWLGPKRRRGIAPSEPQNYGFLRGVPPRACWEAFLQTSEVFQLSFYHTGCCIVYSQNKHKKQTKKHKKQKKKKQQQQAEETILLEVNKIKITSQPLQIMHSLSRHMELFQTTSKYSTMCVHA